MIVALGNSKGGVGKSTIAVHLAAWMAEQGYRFGFVDCDVQASSSTWLKEAAPDVQTFRLVAADDVLEQLPKLAAQFDHLVVDGPAGLSEVTRTILYLSDLAVFPCGPSVLDLRAVIDAVEITRKIQELRSGLPRIIIVPNKLQPRYQLSRDLVETVRGMNMPSGDGLCLRQAYADAAGQGTVVWRMNTEGARAATAELQYLFQQLLSYESPSNPQNNGSRLADKHPAHHA